MVYQLPSTATPATNDKREKAIKPVVDGLRELITSPQGLFTDRPGFIQGGGPQDPFSNVVRDITRLNCRIWASSDKSNYSPRVNQGNAALCNPYLEDIAERPDDGEFGPGWEGGMCNGLAYNITVVIAWTEFSDGSRRTQPVPRTFRGPLSSVSVVGNGGSPNRPIVTICARANGSSNTNPPNGVSGVVQCSNNLLSIGNAVPGSHRVESIAISPRTGTDDCGDGPPVYRPPSQIVRPTPFPPSAPINIPGLGPTNVTVTNTDEGDPIFCFEGVEICVQIGEEGEEPGGGGGAPGGGNSAGGDGLPGDPSAAGAPAFEGSPGEGGEDVDFGPPPEGRVWVGCIARFLAHPGVGVIPGTASANRAYTQVVGNLSLRYGSIRGTAQQVRSQWVDAFRPVTALEVTGAFVNSLPGTDVTIFPISAIVCPEDVCGDSDG